MEPEPGKSPLVVVVGQTASGKSAVALKLAERFDGEIIAADSRTVYRGMDIGTAKPTPEEQARIRHHLIDIVDPNQAFTVSDFQRFAQAAISDISIRGKLPILVGGTGLYIDALLFNFGFRGNADPGRRKELETLSVDELQDLLIKQGLLLPANERNPRHLIRAIESGGAVASRQKIRPDSFVLGLNISKEDLDGRITRRVDAMLGAGLEREALDLARLYGWDCPPMQTIGYQEFRLYAAGATTPQEVRQAIITHTTQYAKRQKTWFRRNESIHWISKTEEAVDSLTTLLNK